MSGWVSGFGSCGRRLRLLERETGIEPASLAWKAKVLPLNYSRGTTVCSSIAVPRAVPRWVWTRRRARVAAPCGGHVPRRRDRPVRPLVVVGGGGWIRTNVGVSQQIYSLPPLATRAPLQGADHDSTARARGEGYAATRPESTPPQGARTDAACHAEYDASARLHHITRARPVGRRAAPLRQEALRLAEVAAADERQRRPPCRER